MPSNTKDHADAIAKKLRATIDKTAKAHDLVMIYHDGSLIATFGIRRGSRKDQGHGHIPKDLHLTPHQTILLARCPLSVDDWHEILRQKGLLEQEREDQA